MSATLATSRLVLLTCGGGHFGQSMKVWKSLHVDRLRASLESRGFFVVERTVEEVANDLTSIHQCLVFYSSTQRPGYKSYIEDVLLALSRCDNVLIPSFDMLRAHENKGYQELLKRIRGIHEIPGAYFSSSGSEGFAWKDWPAVLKWPSGARSTGVHLVSSRGELHKVVSRRERLSFRQSLHALVRRYVLPKPESRDWFEYIRPRQPFVLQRFVPGLVRDFKVLAFGDRFYALERKVRPHDFRASGSGLFAFTDPPEKLLDYAAHVMSCFGEPFLSMDICETSDGCGLLEFQGVHFGPYTLLESPFHFRRSDAGTWEKVYGRADLEENYAHAIASWIHARRIECRSP